MLNNRLAIASVSLGQHTSHTLPQKIDAAAQNGITGIEITYPDLSTYASSQACSLHKAAQNIKHLCREHHLHILALAPFENFEGHTSPIASRLKTAQHWLDIARLLGAEHLQVPSSYDRNSNRDRGVIVSELGQLADLAASSQPVIKVAYENLAWSTHCSLWQEALSIVQEVDRENFGLCLDSFHLAVSLWGDPYSKSGIQRHGERQLARSLRDLVDSCPLERIFYLQLSDGERMDPPYSEEHPWYDASLEVGHVWSMHARPFPLESDCGAYMPVEAIAKAFLVDLDFKGWVSLETFDRRMKQERYTPEVNAERASRSWDDLKKRLSDRQSRL